MTKGLGPDERCEDSGRNAKCGDTNYRISRSGAWVRITPKIVFTITDNKAKLRRIRKGKF